MQLGVNKCQLAAEATDLPSLVNPRAGLPTTSGFESSHVGLHIRNCELFAGRFRYKEFSLVGHLDGLTCLPSGEGSCPFS